MFNFFLVCNLFKYICFFKIESNFFSFSFLTIVFLIPFSCYFLFSGLLIFIDFYLMFIIEVKYDWNHLCYLIFLIYLALSIISFLSFYKICFPKYRVSSIVFKIFQELWKRIRLYTKDVPLNKHFWRVDYFHIPFSELFLRIFRYHSSNLTGESVHRIK
jgi:hypothetical protein